MTDRSGIKKTSNGPGAPIAYYEARSTITGPCGHRHMTKEMAEKCARSFASSYRRKDPAREHTYWHVVSVDANGVRKRVSEDL